MKTLLIILLILVVFSASSCKQEDEMKSIDQYKSEVMQAEKDFAELAKEKGLKIAFTAFAAEDAALNRGKIIKGKKEIEKYYSDEKYDNVSLQWKPDFVDVSSSGDFAYTYGPYEFTGIDENGDTLKSAGIFHTVWKRQPDGEWRFVYD